MTDREQLLRLVDRGQTTTHTARSPRVWIAAPITLVAVAATWTLHPRRSADNRRSWQVEPVPPPMPRLDPDWAARRTAEDSEPLHPTRESESHR
ncbi:hypothetical protein [Streptomyces atratus]|uniref:hypothetical protein n=1 Tax=Streptomyces atratus TaxID=1893 RepID=UPI00364E4A98